MAGTRRRRVAGTSSFEDELAALPVGTLRVTLRFEPNEANAYGISAYVGECHVGYLQTDWAADDPHVVWMKRLHDAHIWPRFEGWAGDERGEWRYVDFMTPQRDELSEVADRLIGGA